MNVFKEYPITTAIIVIVLLGLAFWAFSNNADASGTVWVYKNKGENCVNFKVNKGAQLHNILKAGYKVGKCPEPSTTPDPSESPEASETPEATPSTEPTPESSPEPTEEQKDNPEGDEQDCETSVHRCDGYYVPPVEETEGTSTQAAPKQPVEVDLSSEFKSFAKTGFGF